MSERGVFAVDRGIWEHDVLSENLPLSRREAWLWLLSEAAWKPHRRRLSGFTIEVKRGQVAASLRFIASKWRWSEPKVRRFLTALKNEMMIDAATDAGVTVITVCKYDEYQRVSLPTDAPSERHVDAGATQERRKVEDMEDKEVVGGGGSARAKLISDEAQDTADALAAACGFPDPKACPLGWYGAAAWVQKCFNEGWSADLMIEAAKETAKRKRDGPIEHFKYLEKPTARFIAEQSRPLPVVAVLEAEQLTVKSHAKPRSAIIQAADDLCRKIASFDGPARGPDELRSVEGEAAPRLLSNG